MQSASHMIGNINRRFSGLSIDVGQCEDLEPLLRPADGDERALLTGRLVGDASAVGPKLFTLLAVEVDLRKKWGAGSRRGSRAGALATAPRGRAFSVRDREGLRRSGWLQIGAAVEVAQ